MTLFICQKMQILSEFLPKVWKFANFRRSKMRSDLERTWMLLLLTGSNKSCKDSDLLMILACAFVRKM